MTRWVEGKSRAELLFEKQKIESNLKSIGEKFTMLTGSEFTDTEYGLINTKEDLGCQIYSLYATLGEVNEALKNIAYAN